MYWRPLKTLSLVGVEKRACVFSRLRLKAELCLLEHRFDREHMFE